jgi:sphingosine kinase
MLKENFNYACQTKFYAKTEIDLDSKKIYSFLSVGWGLLADIDVESEFLRTLGESRFTIWSFYRLIKLRSYFAQLSYIPWNQKTQDAENGSVHANDNETSSNPPATVTVDGDFVCVYSSCQSYIGSDLVFAPQATANDGLIHLVYLPGDVGRARSTQFLISLDKGTNHTYMLDIKFEWATNDVCSFRVPLGR